MYWSIPGYDGWSRSVCGALSISLQLPFQISLRRLVPSKRIYHQNEHMQHESTWDSAAAASQSPWDCGATREAGLILSVRMHEFRDMVLYRNWCLWLDLVNVFSKPVSMKLSTHASKHASWDGQFTVTMCIYTHVYIWHNMTYICLYVYMYMYIYICKLALVYILGFRGQPGSPHSMLHGGCLRGMCK